MLLMAAPQRRRHRVRCPICAPLPTLLLLLLLLVLSALAVLTFLHLPLPHHDRLLPRPPTASGVGRTAGDLWASRLAKYYYGCSNATSNFQLADTVRHSNRYLMIVTSGGLNQQRTGKSFWKDASNFGEIFDVNWFISFLHKDVKIIKQLPAKGNRHFISPYSMRVPRKCTPRCYQKRVLPVLLKKHVVQLTKFDFRLANKLGTDLQKLRCRVNYHALKFTDRILEMGRTLIQRMRYKSKHFIALHLRFEPDMLAFSGCYYGGGDKERRELSAIRRRWKTLHTADPERERRHGKCPLTPEEVGLMLRALGFGSDVHIYVASGEVYGGEVRLAPLKALFPNYHSKESIASKEELEPFSSFSSRMAALDFIVCDGSDVFVTNNNGNMARMLAGRRRYFGHKRTIRPNAKKLYSLFLNRTNVSWTEFSSNVQTFQIGFMGEPEEVGPGIGDFHENPSTCICKNSLVMAEAHQTFQRESRIDEPFSDPEPYVPDVDGTVGLPDRQSLDKTEQQSADYDLLFSQEKFEVEEMLSD